MRSITNNIRRATQDMDIDFIRYSLSDESIENFVAKLNCIEGITITRVGKIEELSKQDYKGKRVNVHIKDTHGNLIESKIEGQVFGIGCKIGKAGNKYAKKKSGKL